MRTLTIVPVPGREGEDFGAALPWFPVAGLFLGVVTALGSELWFLFAGSWTEGGAVFVVGLSVVLTRGLHLDGLTDWADSLGVGPDRERRLDVMKDSHTGAFGVLALGLCLLAKWTALARLMEMGGVWLLPLVMLVSRVMMAEMAATLPYARSESGTAAPFVRGATGRRRFAAHAAGAVLALMWGWDGAVCYGAAWVATFVFRGHCKRRFGGVTGDLLGTLNEIIEVALLFLGGVTIWGWRG